MIGTGPVGLAANQRRAVLPRHERIVSPVRSLFVPAGDPSHRHICTR